MKNYKIYYSQLLKFLQELYKNNFNDKIPNTLNMLSKKLLTKNPKCIFFKIIEIKTFYETPDPELEKCFPGDAFPDENDVFKGKIYEFLLSNSKFYLDNSHIFKGITNIIGSLKKDGLIRKYINLIDIFAERMNNDNLLICELLASNPLKYTELISFIDSYFNLSPLPKNPIDFYSISNYKKNIENFKEFNNKKNETIKLQKEFFEEMQKMKNKILEQEKKQNEQEKKLLEQEKKQNEQEKKLLEQNKDISNLKKELSSVKETLFNIQKRDEIKAFYNSLCWSLHVENKDESILENVQNAIRKINEKETEGEKMIIDLLTKIEEYKNSGNDKSHIIKNIGFNKMQLPGSIKEKYDIYYKNQNCGISSCDCIALLLSVQEINNSSIECTKNKYLLLENIINVSLKDWNNNKKIVASYLSSYKN